MVATKCREDFSKLDHGHQTWRTKLFILKSYFAILYGQNILLILEFFRVSCMLFH